MTAPVHFAVGAASALFIQKYLPFESSRKKRIAWAWAAAVVSHVAADTIPHAEHLLKGQQLFLELIAETVVMLVVLAGASLSPYVAAIILAGMVGAAIPDGLSMLSHRVDWPFLLWVDSKIHLFHGKLNLFYANFFLQLVITILCSVYVRTKSAE